MPHGLAHRFVAVDAAEFLMIKEEDANLEDKRDEDKGSWRACGLVVVTEYSHFINVQGA